MKYVDANQQSGLPQDVAQILGQPADLETVERVAREYELYLAEQEIMQSALEADVLADLFQLDGNGQYLMFPREAGYVH